MSDAALIKIGLWLTAISVVFAAVVAGVRINILPLSAGNVYRIELIWTLIGHCFLAAFLGALLLRDERCPPLLFVLAPIAGFPVLFKLIEYSN